MHQSRVRPLFEDERRALAKLDADESDDAGAAWERAYDAIRAATSLVDSEGRPVPEYLLHIDGDEAR